MLNKKTSNVVSVVVALWGFSIVGLLLLKYAEGLVLDQGAFALWLIKALAVALIPLLLIYANNGAKVHGLQALSGHFRLSFTLFGPSWA